VKKIKKSEEERGLEAAARKNPRGAGAVFADWLEDHDRVYEAARWRQRAGLSELRYATVKKVAGLNNPQEWPASRFFSTLSGARGRITADWYQQRWHWPRTSGTPSSRKPPQDFVDQYEIQVFEFRKTFLLKLPSRKETE
jgi:hypothetical protein